jgi:hypothetical protein
VIIPAKWRFPILSAAAVLPLAACGGTGMPGFGSFSSNAAPPPAHKTSAETVKPLETGDMKVADAKGAVKPIDPNAVESVAPIPTPMETFRALAPPEGVKPKPLFEEPVKDEAARVARIEKAVQELRNDFDTITPAVVRMVAMENSMRELIDQLKGLNGAATATPLPDSVPPSSAPSSIPGTGGKPGSKDSSKPQALLPEQAAAIAPAAAPDIEPAPSPALPGAARVTALRTGDHGGTSRIVLELSEKAAATAALDSGGRRLVIDLMNLNWTGAAQAGAVKKGLIGSWKHEGGKVYVDLSQAAEIRAQSVLGPVPGNPHYRLVIDLAAAGG